MMNIIYRQCSPRQWLPGLLVLALLPVLCCPAPGQKRKRGKVPRASTTEEDGYTRIDLESPVQGTGFLYVPKTLPKDRPEKPGLLVVLHGHGSTPKNMMRRQLADTHKDYMISVQGPNVEGQGFAWSDAGVPIINNLVRYVLAKHPINSRKVVLIGHSAGGTMVLKAYPAAPKLYSGMITVAAPMTPTSAHRKGRVCVFLGTADPNYSGARAVQSTLGGKNKWKNGCLIVMEGAEHNNLPPIPYLILAIDWCLQAKARGAEVQIPFERQLAPKAAPFHYIRVGYKGAEGWENPRNAKGKKSKARKLLSIVAKYVPRGKSYFPFEAFAHSEHEPTFKLAGAISLKELEALGPEIGEAAKNLEANAVSKVIETPKGYHLIWKAHGAGKKPAK